MIDGKERERHRRSRKAEGFTLVGLLIVLAIIGLASVAVSTVASLAKRRMAEQQLLYVGAQYRQAILAYAAATPPGAAVYPRALADLLKDPRFATTRRYLRELYADPISGADDWVLVTGADGGIVGLHSRSTKTPLKVDGFHPPFQAFAHRGSYTEWVFGAENEFPIAQVGADVAVRPLGVNLVRRADLPIRDDRGPVRRSHQAHAGARRQRGQPGSPRGAGGRGDTCGSSAGARAHTDARLECRQAVPGCPRGCTGGVSHQCYPGAGVEEGE
jgi:type II secretory pathway pseudopilin PulG